MPLYEFVCPHCNAVIEKICASDVYVQSCDCGTLAKRIISIPTIKLDGTDPGFPGAYMKWGNDREKRAEKKARDRE